MQKTLQLPPSTGNPRNSEGDFITLNDGRILFIYTHFTGGRSDHAEAALHARSSADKGLTWSSEDRLVLPNEGGCNIMSVSLLRLQDGRIALFYIRKNSLADCRPIMRLSRDEGESWGAPQLVIPDDDIGYFVLNNNRVIQLQSGRLVLPVALHNRPDWAERDWSGEVMCFLSDDSGANWRRSRSAHRAFDAHGTRVVAQEPAVIERTDGSLWMLIRSNAGVQYQSVSTDRGETWSPPEPSTLASPQSPASISRIPATGDMVLVWNDHRDAGPELQGKRTPLAVAVSPDDGLTWRHRHILEDDPEGWYCYTAIECLADRILLGYAAGSRAEALAMTQITVLPLDWLYEA